MTRILLRDLEPGRLYHIQARATNGEESSQWSQLWDLQTTSDIMPPAAPTGLSWTVQGTAFNAVWTGPTTNQDGTTLKDFKDFQVKVYSPSAPGTVATYYTPAARFDFPFELNVNALGTPRAQVTIEVRARDNTGNLSTAATATATNPAPANVSNFTATAATDSISLKWDQNTDTDLKYYQVYQGTALGAENTLVYTGLGNSYKFETLSTNPQYFKIYAVDVFNTQSATAAQANATARSSLGVDTTPPAAPTGVTVSSSLDSSDVTGSTAYIDVSWTGVADTDLQNYSVRYSTGTSWQYINVPDGTTSARINGLSANTAYNVAVASVDFQGNSSAYTNAGTYPITTTRDTTAPSTPSAPTIAANALQIQVSHAGTKAAGGALESDVQYLEVHVSTTNGFTVSSSTMIGRINFGLANVGTFPIPASASSGTAQTWYAKVVAVDYAGNRSGSSAGSSASVPLIASTNIQDATITNAKISDLAADKLSAGSAFINQLNIRNSLIIDNASGEIKSSNYSAGSAGWRLYQTTLEINQGTIRAAALLLQSGENLIHPAYSDFEWAPSWYTTYPLPMGWDTGGSATNGVVDTATVTPKYNVQCLRLVRASGGTYARVVLTSGTVTSYNVTLEPSTDYIVSAWIMTPNASGDKLVSLNLNSSAGASSGSQQTITADGTWQRISSVLTTNSSGQVNMDVKLWTVGTIYIDGVQIERKLTSQTTPSSWRPPSVTSVDGGIIRTGSIQSTAAANGLSGQPAWSINMSGAAQFGDAMVRGRLVVGDPSNPSADGVNSRIMSANYVANSSGWIIRNDGFAEFNNVTIRSGNTISGTALYYSGTPASGNLFLSFASASGTDSFGNTYPKGVGIGPATAPQVVMNTNGSAGYIQFPTHRPIENTVAQLLVGVVNSGAANEYASLQMKGPTVTGATDYSSLSLNSQNNDGSSNANLALKTGTASFIMDQDVITLTGPRLTILPTASGSSVIYANAATGHTGNLFRAAINSTDYFTVDSNGVLATYANQNFSTYSPISSGHGSGTFSSKTGWYQRIGKMIYFTAYFTMSVAGSGPTPWAFSAPTSIDRTTRQVVFGHMESGGAPGSISAVAFTGGSGVMFDRVRSSTGVNITGGDLTVSAIVTFSGWYREA